MPETLKSKPNPPPDLLHQLLGHNAGGPYLAPHISIHVAQGATLNLVLAPAPALPPRRD